MLDPWFVAALIAPLGLLFFLAGGPIGEPVADDYNFLYHVLFTGSWSWFDTCGEGLYWRPIARQAYYALLAPWMLYQPLAVALVQMVCLCLAAGLLYRTFVGTLGRGVAFVVSTAPWMMESSRLLIAWPACFQDVGALLFVSLALHEAVARRRWSFLGAGLAALLCKEVAAIALITVVVFPAVQFASENQRRVWLVSTGLVVAAWATMYLWVFNRAAETFAVPGTQLSLLDWARGIAVVPWWSFKAIWSLPPSSNVVDLFVALGLLAIVPWSRVGKALRHQWPQLRGWWTWGLLWSLPLLLTLVPFYPGWWPFRMAFVGFGVLTATMVTLRAIHRYALPTFVVLRLGFLVIAPGPVHEVGAAPPVRGASIDVPQLSRLQRLVADVRSKLHARYPELSHGSTVVWENFPTMIGHGFGSRPALCVWYRDSSLKWVPISSWMADPSRHVATIVEYQGDRQNEVALVEPEAMRAVLNANSGLSSGQEAESLRWLARAESLQTDTTATFFLRSIMGKRAFALANLSFQAGRYAEARSHLLALLEIYPRDVPGQHLLKVVEDSLANRRHF